MNTHRCRWRLRAALTLSSLLCASASAQTVAMPAGVIEGGYNLAGKYYLTPSNHPFFFAATVNGSAHDKSGGSIKVARPTAGHAAVYTSAPVSSPPLLPATLGAAQKFEFKTVGDHVQAWATMTDQGVPHVWLRGSGQFKGDATVSWRTSFNVHPQQPQVVLVRLVLPPLSVSGVNEQQGYALWRSRLRGELLANGVPVWSTDALRLAHDPKVVNSNLSETVVLQEFGHALRLPDDDEDDDDGNNSARANQPGAPKQILYVTLGNLPAGKQVDLSFVLRATAFTDPVAGGASNNHRCKKQVNEFFCAQAAVTIDGAGGEAPRIYLLQ